MRNHLWSNCTISEKSVGIIENEEYSKKEYAQYVKGFKLILYTNYANTLISCGIKLKL